MGTGLALGLVLLLSDRPALAHEDWTPVLRPPAHGTWYRPDEALRIDFQRGRPRLAGLRLELDDVDVTDLAEGGARGIGYRPPRPLGPGFHELRLLEMHENGDVMEKGFWRFEVRHSAEYREARVEAGADVALHGRVSQGGLWPAPPREVAQMEGRVAAGLESDQHLLQASAQLVHDSSLSEDRTQIYEFLVGLKALDDRWRLRVGQQQVDGENLIRADFTRRGLTGRLAGRLAGVEAYVLNTQSQAGIQDPLGLQRPGQRTGGAAVYLAPYASPSGGLVLRAEALSARGSEIGVAESGGTLPGEEPPAGDAWSLAVDGRSLGGRLRLYGEYAGSRYDFGGGDSRFSDHAVQALAELASPEGADLGWQTRLLYREVGSFFRSLANPALPNDRRLTSLTVTLRRASLEVELEGGVESDNVRNLSGIPTVEGRFGRLRLDYQPEQTGRLPRLFSQPVLRLAVERLDRRETGLPADSLFSPIRDTALDVQAAADFSPGPWRWSVSYRTNRVRDRSGAGSDTRDGLLGLEIHLPVRDGFWIQPAVQRGHSRDDTQDLSTTESTVGLAAGARLGRFQGSLDFSRTRLHSEALLLDSRQQVLGLTLAYQVLEARPQVPGIGLFFNANWTTARENGLAESTARQAYLGVRASYQRPEVTP